MAPDSAGPKSRLKSLDPDIRRARKSPILDAIDTEALLDMRKLRAYRLGRFRAELKKRDCMGALLYDPINIRYATGSRNMAVWTLHNAVRYAFIPTEGPITIFDFHNCEHLSDGLETVAEVRPAVGWTYFGGGSRLEEFAKRWSAEIVDLVKTHGGGNRRLAVDKLDPVGTHGLEAAGIQIVEGQAVCELARAIKSDEEIACMVTSVTACETGMARMREALKPGMTENELWSLLHQANIAAGGEWIETRLLTSGGRTNPWFQESSDRVIRSGELVSFDTDLIGPFGYCADISRTYFCGHGKPTDEQKQLYGLAYEQIHTNLDLVKAGIGFREFSEKSFRLPEKCAPNRYSVVFHGVGLADEYPASIYAQDYEKGGYDGVLEAGMTICIESYMGEVGGLEGVKLEQQILVTETGYQLLSTFPFEEQLLPSRWL
ncbi:MAG TPA: Xaa-Pro peptidase family protein [Hypericibacter adhaerens]|uniref:Xaa-Pro peptidase family protein n=1 Tax=Hypericibacter adhaerens TaxID=2602016 RepID=UPI002B9E0D3B|nr:Xaa-Pro peptidase family protein [Hypericibacter adhaerens]HWA42022.1 Xaa-Pro peptidase family protein [Hypericibacter adhaerens]